MKLNGISETTLLRLEQHGFVLRKIFYGPLGLVMRAEAEAFCRPLHDEGHTTFSAEGFHDGRTCIAVYSKEPARELNAVQPAENKQSLT